MTTNALLILAMTLYLEAGGEPAEGQRAVASVIWNRAQRDQVGLVAVVLRPRQFSCWNGRDPARAKPPRDCASWRHCRALAAELVAGEFEASGPWTHYYAPRLCQPRWAAGLRHRRVIGGHEFGVTE